MRRARALTPFSQVFASLTHSLLNVLKVKVGDRVRFDNAIKKAKVAQTCVLSALLMCLSPAPAQPQAHTFGGERQ